MTKEFKINGHDVEFIVSEENRIVVAQIRGCSGDIYIKDEKFGYIRYHNFAYDVAMNSRYKATARCSPEDTFDENIGKQIAFDRLQIKYWVAYNKRINRIINKVSNIIDSLTTEYDKAELRASIDPLDCVYRQDTE